MNDFDALERLKAAGIKIAPNGMILSPERETTEAEREAIYELTDEWDYGYEGDFKCA